MRRLGRQAVDFHDAVQGGRAGFAHHLRDKIARLLKFAGQRIELRRGQSQHGKRCGDVIVENGGIAQRLGWNGRQLGLCPLGAVQ